MIRILILLFILMFFYKRELFTNPNSKPKIECNKKLKIKEFKEILNFDKKIKKDILRPKGVLPHNLNDTNRYNILNNFGVKNNKKRESYFRSLNDNNTIPHNSAKLLNNYDKVLDETFSKSQTQYPGTAEEPTKAEIKQSDFKDIYLISDDLKAQFSYDSNLLKSDKTKLYLYYDIVDSCDDSYDFNKLKKLRLDKSINLSNDFSITMNHYNDRNIYKLEFKNLKKQARVIVVLKHDKKIIKKSNYVILKLNNI